MIGILDYGVGNLKAFANVLKGLNFHHQIVKTEQELKGCEKIIMPGVGSFDSVMNKLIESGIRDVLSDLIINKKIPILGVCVGMQILASSSEEGSKSGLGWIRGRVKKFNFDRSDFSLTIPQIGWNEVNSTKENTLLKNLEKNPRFYFLHSYYIECEDKKDVIAIANYGGDFTCAVNRENIYGTQFHPEKSHHNGVALIRNFASL
ncbi:imidazole glycerol phosphate synthase subunit HisH [Leptospira borgpetersenii]|uniref:Imidazole glycerol phosphate synthase subunit HisH n=3 Tax=Leptospira borgpetersenii TaxID=174 RepID=HIS5_LEPBO|nr:imidazole glycerol phosphate synthase subunit HisH [Leptospira borgpetersenii]Q9ZGM1.1 RecName: Full=Imidazole glycerol phosphate synthase subunit HisH; AltName: Full=IGP synthase glutaminase subunit; AltName: Full=IGP synthase subunit HisH; AltName: Full=ImGP synthase subunit HisH; Short=IGPS subunit HisH [Leptospira borgpetersenii]AAD12948.1 unknown [Leptospira borgpetersenii]ABJ75767.1 Glutamine amidotransferase [Leptospira borgpetersenii serovar Hardjo-bovis str. JB197]ABJ78712.1 Glutami